MIIPSTSSFTVWGPLLPGAHEPLPPGRRLEGAARGGRGMAPSRRGDRRGCGRELGSAITVETYTNYTNIYTVISYSVLLYYVMLFYVSVHMFFSYIMLYFVMLCFIILKFNQKITYFIILELLYIILYLYLYYLIYTIYIILLLHYII